jgi:hypothetical protein
MDLDAVDLPAAQQFVEGRQLVRAARHHQLAASVHGKLSLEAIRGHAEVAFTGEAGLEAVGRVVEPRVQHAAVPAARVLAERAFLLDHAHRGVRMPGPELARERQPDDPAADDEVVRVIHSWLWVGQQKRTAEGAKTCGRSAQRNCRK